MERETEKRCNQMETECAVISDLKLNKMTWNGTQMLRERERLREIERGRDSS